MKPTIVLAAIVLAIAAGANAQMPLPTDKIESELVAKYGEGQRLRAHRGLAQVAEFWRPADGDAAAFEEFARTNFAGDQPTLDALFDRMQFVLESFYGHANEIGRDCRQQTDLDLGPIYPFDETLAAFDPSAHFTDDFFADKLAFTVLLNFPLTTLEQRLTEGDNWTRRQWAEARLARASRSAFPPTSIRRCRRRQRSRASTWPRTTSGCTTCSTTRGSGSSRRRCGCSSHWNLRDEIKADYSDATNGLAKQRMIQKVMERIVDQTIPAAVVDNPHVDWNPFTNEVAPAAVDDSAPDQGRPAPAKTTNAPEPNTRYAMLLETFQASRLVDPYSPTAPTLIARRFDEDRQIPEPRVRAMLEQIVSSPLVPRVAALIGKRFGRQLEPFDIWYNGFRPRGSTPRRSSTRSRRSAIRPPRPIRRTCPAVHGARLREGEGAVPRRQHRRRPRPRLRPRDGRGARGPTRPTCARASARTAWTTRATTSPSTRWGTTSSRRSRSTRSTIHRSPASLTRRSPRRWRSSSRTRTWSCSACRSPTPESEALKTLNDFWGTYEIAGVALVDMDVWHWMYDHPDATPDQLRDAVVPISKSVWNKYYAPVFKQTRRGAAGVYSHMIDSFLYLPDYPIGHMIAFQIEQQMEKAGNIGGEFERMAKFGNVTPDLWMKHATGAPVGPQALLSATEKALGVAK